MFRLRVLQCSLPWAEERDTELFSPVIVFQAEKTNQSYELALGALGHRQERMKDRHSLVALSARQGEKFEHLQQMANISVLLSAVLVPSCSNE